MFHLILLCREKGKTVRRKRPSPAERLPSLGRSSRALHQSAQDQRACLLCGSFKYMTSNRTTSQRQSVHESFYSVAGRATRATFDALAASGVNAQ